MQQKKPVQEIAHEAVEELREAAQSGAGRTYQEIKESAAKNLPKSEKKVVKSALQEVNNEITAKNAERARVVAEEIRSADAHAAAAKGLRQGLNSADVNEVIDTYEAAIAHRENARNQADLIKEQISNSTRKNRIRAQVAENKAQEAKVETRKVLEASKERIKQLDQQAAKKAEDIAKLQASPNYERGQAKMAENAKKTMAAAQKRTDKKLRDRLVKKYMNVPTQKLEADINGGKLDKAAEDVIMEILEKRYRQ